MKKPRQERYKSGHLWEENGKWWLRYPERMADGTIERPTVCVGTSEQYDTHKKARTAADEIMKRVNEAAAVTRFGSLCDDYVKNGMAHLRGYTQQGYRSITKGIRNATLPGKNGAVYAFAEERVDTLALTSAGRLNLEQWLNGLKITANYRAQIKKVLYQIFDHARRYDYLRGENPVDLIRTRNMPHNTRPRRRRDVVKPEQLRALLQDPELLPVCKVLLVVMELSGIRGCEALGLKWSDIEWKATPPKIQVRRSSIGKFLEEPKTIDSLRAAALTAPLIAILRQWKASSIVVDDWVFGSARTGRPWHPNNIRRHISDAAKRAGFYYLGLGLHNHRHTFRRNIKNAGAPEEEQARALGHSDIRTTRKYGNDGVDFTVDFAPYAERVGSQMELVVGAELAPHSLSASSQPVSTRNSFISMDMENRRVLDMDAKPRKTKGLIGKDRASKTA